MNSDSAAALPRRKGRMAGVFYLLMALAGTIETFARKGLIVKGDAAATASAILAHLPMYHLAYAADLLVAITYVVVVVLFYRLFGIVDRNLGIAALCFGTMGCTILSVGSAFLQAPLVLHAGAPFASALPPEQVPALAYAFVALYSKVYAVAMVFFGCFCFTIGLLVVRSTFLPRFLGVLSMVAGLSWFVFIDPDLGSKLLTPWLAIFGLGEYLLIFWLLVFGADAQKWREQAGRAQA